MGYGKLRKIARGSKFEDNELMSMLGPREAMVDWSTSVEPELLLAMLMTSADFCA